MGPGSLNGSQTWLDGGAWRSCRPSEVVPAHPLACRSSLAVLGEPCPASTRRASVGPGSLNGSQSWLDGGAWRSCRPFKAARAHPLACRSLLAVLGEPYPASTSGASWGAGSLNGSQSWLHGGAWRSCRPSEVVPAHPLACRSLLALRNEPCPASTSRASVRPGSLNGSQTWLHGGAWHSCRPFQMVPAHPLAGSQSASREVCSLATASRASWSAGSLNGSQSWLDGGAWRSCRPFEAARAHPLAGSQSASLDV